MDCAVVFLSASFSLLNEVDSVWYIERGRSRPNLEPVTAVPRARGSVLAGFVASAAPIWRELP